MSRSVLDGTDGRSVTPTPAEDVPSRDPHGIGRAAIRSLPSIGAAVAVLLGAPSAVFEALALVGLLICVLLAGRSRQGGPADAVLLSVGGALVLAVLVGLVLDLTPAGLTRTTWVVGTSIVEVVVIVATRATPREPAPWRGMRAPRGLVWYVGGLGVLGVALGLSVIGAQRSDRAPVALSLARTTPSGITVAVTSGSASGPLLVAREQNGTLSIVRSDLKVGPGHSLLVELHGRPGQVIDVRLLEADVYPPDQIARVNVRLPLPTR